MFSAARNAGAAALDVQALRELDQEALGRRVQRVTRQFVDGDVVLVPGERLAIGPASFPWNVERCERRLDGVFNVAPDGWIGGERVRVEISNEYGTEPLVIGAVRAAVTAWSSRTTASTPTSSPPATTTSTPGTTSPSSRTSSTTMPLSSALAMS